MMRASPYLPWHLLLLGSLALLHLASSEFGLCYGFVLFSSLQNRHHSSDSISQLILSASESEEEQSILISSNHNKNTPLSSSSLSSAAAAAATTSSAHQNDQNHNDSEITYSSEQSKLFNDEPKKESLQPQQPQQQPQQQQQSFTLTDRLQRSIFLGIAPTPQIFAIMTIYFVEGALGLASLAQTFVLKEQLQLGPADLASVSALMTLPWTLKPLYGFVSDAFPLFGYQRRSYLILSGFIGAFSYTALGSDFWGLNSSSSSSSFPWTIAAFLLTSACIAFSDVVADGLVVSQTRQHQSHDNPELAGGLQSLCWGSASVGGLLTTYFSGSLLETMTPQQVFSMTACLPFLVTLTAFFIQEKRIEPEHTHNEHYEVVTTLDKIRQQIMDLKSAVQQPSIWKPMAFLFLWQSTPTSDGAFFYFLTDELGFGPEFLGRIGVVSEISSLLGICLYQKYLRRVPIKDILFWSSILSVPLGLTTLFLITHTNRSLGIPDAAFVFGDDVILTVLGQIASLPTLVLAARLCPPGVEAVLFATLMSINNGASAIGTELGAILTSALGITETDNSNLGLLTVICNFTSLYPLFFIGWLDGVGDVSQAEVEDD